MLMPIEGLPDGVVGIEASGKVTAEDYERVLEPAVESGLQHHSKVRFLYHLGRDFTGFTAAALWDDAKVALHHKRDFEKCAVVTDAAWVRDAVRLFRALMPCPVQVFRNDHLGDAKAWLST